MLNAYGLDDIDYMSIAYATTLDCPDGGGSSPDPGDGGGGGDCQSVTRQNNPRYYYLKDHLGTVKMTVNSGGTVTSYDDYYPFGMVMEGRSGNFTQPDARFKFTGKERDVSDIQSDPLYCEFTEICTGRVLNDLFLQQSSEIIPRVSQS